MLATSHFFAMSSPPRTHAGPSVWRVVKVVGVAMWIHLGGVYAVDDEAFDFAITDSLTFSTQLGEFVAFSTGYEGGLSIYQVAPSGEMTLIDTYQVPAHVYQLNLRDTIRLAEVNGEMIIFFGANAQGLIGARVRDDGTFNRTAYVDFAELEVTLEQSDGAGVSAMNVMSDYQASFLPTNEWHQDTVAFHTLEIAGETFFLALGRYTNQINSYQLGANGLAQFVHTMGPEQNLGISAPTAMEVVSFADQTYAIVAAAIGSSLFVLKVGTDGALQPVQHIIDTASTRFANVQDIAVAKHGDHVFVFAVGADDGITMFRLLPDGHLVFVEALVNGGGVNLSGPFSVSANVVGDHLNVFVGMQFQAGASHFYFNLAQMGEVVTGTGETGALIEGGSGHDVLIAAADNDTLIGGSGNDMLVSGPGHTVMTGGSGVDTFVIRAHSHLVTITDFERGVDRLDLTDLPMLRWLGQLSHTATPTGAVLTYRDVTVILHAADGQALGLFDLFPSGLVGPDNIFIVLEETEPIPDVEDPVAGMYLEASEGNNSIIGSAGNDTLWGNSGNDTIRGGDGDDLIHGVSGDNRLWGGAGNDTIYGGSGNDIIGGGPGDDLIYSGEGQNTVYGAAGNDTIFGGDGGNRLWGGPGDDLIYGGDGDDRLGAGAGNDTVYTGGGNNVVYGGGGDDLIIVTGGGNNTIFGGEGNDTLIGGPGNDRLGGGPGDDRLHAGPGDDTMRGGNGADTFVFHAGDELLLVLDFTYSDNDMLELQEAIWGGGLTPVQVVDQFGSVLGDDIVLNFGGGDIITLQGLGDIFLLHDYITLV